MLERAVFLDRDNTIIENDGYLGDPSRVKLLPGAATALAAMRQLGYRLIVVSNQSGVARGLFDEAAVEAVNTEMSRQLQEQGGAYIDASYYCPYHPDAPLPEYRVDHDWRKPKCGMLKQAATDFRLDLAQSWMIGDQNRDIGAGAAAGCRTILLKDPDRSAAVETDLGRTVSPSFVVRTLADAARIIAREGRNPPAQAAPVRAAPAASGGGGAGGGAGGCAGGACGAGGCIARGFFAGTGGGGGEWRGERGEEGACGIAGVGGAE
jgi:D-glycero-D-manno-heptose 1,7-bisphosphate phosphatase